MRVLIGVALTFMVSLLSPQAQATQNTIPAKHISITVQHHHGSEWTKVYKQKAGWICATESAPRFKAIGNPLSQLSEFKFSAAKTDIPLCKVKVTIDDFRENKKRTWIGCSEEPKIQKFLRQLNSSCRAGITDEK